MDPFKVICIFSGIVRSSKDRGSAGKLVRLTHLTVWRSASRDGKYGHISRELLAITLWITCTGWSAVCWARSFNKLRLFTTLTLLASAAWLCSVAFISWCWSSVNNVIARPLHHSWSYFLQYQ